ncbi:probable RNA-directed DNA polymerase from transposon X-element [Trichonephila clavipes]|nr:probable RNA-directed DNA polymerase from transposon X-element [Trichonephila clavipes]
MAVTDPQKANLLANTIKNNFIENNRMQDNYDQDDEVVTSAVNTFLSSPLLLKLNLSCLMKLLTSLKILALKKAPGKDTITNKMLKNFPIKLILILTILVNKILKFHHFPSNWKEAIIFPIIKPGTNKNLPNSYRPISLLSTLSKLTEYIILNRLKKFINDNSLINPNQYGFTNKLSTLHPLLRLTESISEGFKKKEEHGSGLSGYPESLRPCLDFRTHFQTNYLRYSFSPHSPHPLVFTNRSFRIRVNESLSNSHSISAGCPQGSLLGPLLFNLYINDIPSYSLTNISLYADDTAINATYKNLKTVTFAINKHLKLLENYYDRWKISINVENLVPSSLPKSAPFSPLS